MPPPGQIAPSGESTARPSIDSQNQPVDPDARFGASPDFMVVRTSNRAPTGEDDQSGDVTICIIEVKTIKEPLEEGKAQLESYAMQQHGKTRTTGPWTGPSFLIHGKTVHCYRIDPSGSFVEEVGETGGKNVTYELDSPEFQQRLDALVQDAPPVQG
ncbi:hypothetical protein BOTBODRAFT_145834 [Botryobasidium botryosum FD-172 SS1]|uniref:Uncharacterized protein n=1 Tax=Botryobasidium botryosum (strain FD-172 SS1) TaxID=930990 RepID=A0A067MPX5_BOTB1|nr:hypothetical protein BOTBODRAFT_145834 [Botryobasidium botryosum FD-172 SS1]